MKLPNCRSLIALALAALPLLAPAATFKSVGVPAAILYDGPSVRSNKVFLAPRAMPVEIISTIDQWVKIRDMSGDVMWVVKKDLSDARTVVALGTLVVRSQPADSAPALFSLERSMVLEYLDPVPNGPWVRVRHRDGTIGYVRDSEVWGL